MKRILFLLLIFVFSKTMAITEYEIDFTISTSEYSMDFRIASSTNQTVYLGGGGEYDDGDRYYDTAVELKLGDIVKGKVLDCDSYSLTIEEV